ncbi:MAG: hypothetical protein K2I89_03960 [Muribaculaceae bacterium]|nr:hypothetical protein [Muribaculaceae bacterium]
MKKLLLSFAAACVVTAASAAVADLTKVWEKPVENAYKADAKAWNAPVAVDAAGNVIATGAFTEDLTIAGSTFEATGTSAYVVKYDKTGAAAWAVAFTGAATITAIDTDADGNIYIAGTFADAVTFGTTSGTPIVKEGMKIDDAFTTKQNASFIAKYSSAGTLATVETFVPEVHAEPLEHQFDDPDTGGTPYWFSDGDIYFELKDLKVVDDQVYASATYTGLTKNNNIEFSAPYVVYAFFMYQDVAASSVFTLNASDLKVQQKVVTASYSGENASGVFDTSACWSVRFDVKENVVLAAFVASGEISLTDAKGSQAVNEESAPAFILAKVQNGEIITKNTIAATSSMTVADNSFANISFNGNKAIAVGRKFETETIEGSSDEKKHYNIFVANVSDDLALDFNKFEESAVGINYYTIASTAILPVGEVYINTLGYDNKGDFANTAKSFVFANDAFAPATTVADAVGVAAAGTYVAFSQIGETGAVFSLYNDSKATGIADIVADENAEAEYFNLQGVRVANPENGLYIVRRGNTVTKQLLRK